MRFSHLAKISGALLLTTGLAATANANSYGSAYNGQTPHEACKSDENRGKLIGGGIGAVAGAVLGSQVAGNGARTEASVIGGVLGGLAGAGIADKRVDCDPVYTHEGHPVSSESQTYGSSTTYGSAPVHGTRTSNGYHQTTSYPQEDYGVRTTVSDHPVYQNPTWGARPAQTYRPQTVSRSVYSQPTYRQASYSQPTHSTSTTRYVNSAPATTYVRPVATTYVRPQRSESYRYRSQAPHYHGRHSCSDWH